MGQTFGIDKDALGKRIALDHLVNPGLKPVDLMAQPVEIGGRQKFGAGQIAVARERAPIVPPHHRRQQNQAKPVGDTRRDHPEHM